MIKKKKNISAFLLYICYNSPRKKFGDVLMLKKIDLKLKNNDETIIKENINGDKKNNVLSFKYDNESIKIDINKDNIVMHKDNSESILSFNFIKNKKTVCEYFIKELNFYIDTKVLTNEILINDNQIYIEYELWLQDDYTGKFIYDLKLKEVK